MDYNLNIFSIERFVLFLVIFANGAELTFLEPLVDATLVEAMEAF